MSKQELCCSPKAWHRYGIMHSPPFVLLGEHGQSSSKHCIHHPPHGQLCHKGSPAENSTFNSSSEFTLQNTAMYRHLQDTDFSHILVLSLCTYGTATTGGKTHTPRTESAPSPTLSLPSTNGVTLSTAVHPFALLSCRNPQRCRRETLQSCSAIVGGNLCISDSRSSRPPCHRTA